jgi:hypothetical protein
MGARQHGQLAGNLDGRKGTDLCQLMGVLAAILFRCGLIQERSLGWGRQATGPHDKC